MENLSTPLLVVPDELRFVVPGEPVAWQRTGSSKAGGRGHRFTQSKTRKYEKVVRDVAAAAVARASWCWGKDDRFSLIVKVYRTHWDKGGDIDNCLKGLLDGMNTVVFADDRYVRGIGIAFPRPDPRRPRVEVTVRRFRKGTRPAKGANG